MKSLMQIALVAGMALPLAPAAFANSPGSGIDGKPIQINVSCYRGPIRSLVWWDRPNAVFLDDLVGLGYSHLDAASIGERICRDIRGLGNGDYQIEMLRQIIASAPPKG